MSERATHVPRCPYCGNTVVSEIATTHDEAGRGPRFVCAGPLGCGVLWEPGGTAVLASAAARAARSRRGERR